MVTRADQLRLFNDPPESVWEATYGASRPPLAAQLADRRRLHERGADGPARLLRDLVQRGLSESALADAARLIEQLDEEARR